MSLLEIKHLKVNFKTRKGELKAVEDVSFSLKSGKTLAVVGESGSGKSVTAMSILGLLDINGKITDGEILFDDDGKITDLTKISLSQMQKIRGNKISVIFQEPMTALNPVLTIGKQLAEPFMIHQNLTKKQALEESKKLLEEVHIPSSNRVIKEYPHTLSGGMRQRVMIAMALACKPKLLIADEPTTALDVTIQAQILKLMQELQKKTGTAILFITHDLGVVNEVADDVAVMYAGRVVELASKGQVFNECLFSHPYTEGLFLSVPNKKRVGKRLNSIEGNPPSLSDMPTGCKFKPRCPYATEKCLTEPPLIEVTPKHFVRCFYAKKENGRREEVSL